MTLENELPQMTDNEINISEEVEVESESLRLLKTSIDTNIDAAIICEAKHNNPNYLSIIHANRKFYDVFGLDNLNLIGKNYDFLFSDLDVDDVSDDQLEYVVLLKAVKEFHPCAVMMRIYDHRSEPSKIRCRITFTPTNITDNNVRHATFSFEKIEIAALETKANVSLLKNLERTLRNERLLREVGALIISDLPISDVAQSIAKTLCQHLKTDRCVIHDYDQGATNFVIEYHDSSSKSMLEENQESTHKMLTDYINFQNHFYEKFGSKGRRSSISIAENVDSDANFFPIRETCEKFSILSQIAVTTTFSSKVNGGIYIHQSSARSWLADEIELIEMIADQFSIALDRSDSIEKVMVSNHALMEKTAQLKESLEHEQEMRQMQNEFVALVSHEFKTPLQIIDSTRELIGRKIKNLNVVDESLDKALERIKSGIQRMNGLIHTTLNLAKMESGGNKIKVESEIFDLRKFTADIVEKNSNLAQNKQISVVLKIDDLPTEFIGDPKLLDHAFTNIISNAVKYSKNNSTVKILAKSNDKKIAIRIIDQGIGIPKDDLENIGQKFFRAKNTLSVAGTGIGLYLTKHFIELHGGEITIDSEINVGTSVTVTLPRQN